MKNVFIGLLFVIIILFSQEFPAPKNLVATLHLPVKGGIVELVWDAPLSKELLQYNIYRNTSMIATSDSTFWEDLSPIEGMNNTYYITAVYNNPSGESEPSNEDTVYVPGGGFLFNVRTRISGGDLIIEWDEIFGAQGYNVYSSDDPYGIFTFVMQVDMEQYITPMNNSKRYYYITAFNYR